MYLFRHPVYLHGIFGRWTRYFDPIQTVPMGFSSALTQVRYCFSFLPDFLATLIHCPFRVLDGYFIGPFYTNVLDWVCWLDCLKPLSRVHSSSIPASRHYGFLACRHQGCPHTSWSSGTRSWETWGSGCIQWNNSTPQIHVWYLFHTGDRPGSSQIHTWCPHFTSKIPLKRGTLISHKVQRYFYSSRESSDILCCLWDTSWLAFTNETIACKAFGFYTGAILLICVRKCQFPRFYKPREEILVFWWITITSSLFLTDLYSGKEKMKFLAWLTLCWPELNVD